MPRRCGPSRERHNAGPLNGDLRNLVHRLGGPLAQANRMATLTPAAIVDFARYKGSIEPGKDADLVAIDEQFNVHWTMVQGEILFEAGAA